MLVSVTKVNHLIHISHASMSVDCYPVCCCNLSNVVSAERDMTRHDMINVAEVSS